MHGNVMTAETVDLLAEKQIPLVPTILLLDNWAEYGPSIGSPRPIVDACRRMLERTSESLHMGHEAGVKFVIGTDTGFAMTPYGEWHAKELELLMKYAGVSELEAIAAATYNAGIVLNLEGQVGAIAPGMLADALVIDGDPSEDITVLQDRTRIEEIILDGELMEIDRDIESWPNQPSHTYANRYLTQEVAHASARRTLGPPAAAETPPDAGDTEQAIPPVPGNPIAE
jgi:imidazolonepropionase-like amidohydrolase